MAGMGGSDVCAGDRTEPRAAKGAIALGVAIGIALGSAVAGATPISVGGAGGPAFPVDPIYFQAFGQFGLTGAGKGPDYRATAPVPFLSAGAGAGMDLTVSLALHTPVYQHPQNPANSLNPGTNGGVPTSPTAALPFVADSTWTITNTSGHALAGVLLLFTKVSSATGYPAVDVALDDNLFATLLYKSSSGASYDFGALPLGNLAAGAKVSVLVRYIVADPLLLQGSTYVMPPFALAGLAAGSYVPEPATAALLLAGLGILASRRRRA